MMISGDNFQPAHEYNNSRYFSCSPITGDDPTGSVPGIISTSACLTTPGILDSTAIRAWHAEYQSQVHQSQVHGVLNARISDPTEGLLPAFACQPPNSKHFSPLPIRIVGFPQVG
jgi:hypothetical protein